MRILGLLSFGIFFGCQTSEYEVKWVDTEIELLCTGSCTATVINNPNENTQAIFPFGDGSTHLTAIIDDPFATQWEQNAACRAEAEKWVNHVVNSNFSTLNCELVAEVLGSTTSENSKSFAEPAPENLPFDARTAKFEFNQSTSNGELDLGSQTISSSVDGFAQIDIEKEELVYLQLQFDNKTVNGVDYSEMIVYHQNAPIKGSILPDGKFVFPISRAGLMMSFRADETPVVAEYQPQGRAGELITGQLNLNTNSFTMDFFHEEGVEINTIGIIENRPPVSSFNYNVNGSCEALLTSTSTDPNGNEEITIYAWFRNNKAIGFGSTLTTSIKNNDIIKLVTFDTKGASSHPKTQIISAATCP